MAVTNTAMNTGPQPHARSAGALVDGQPNPKCDHSRVPRRTHQSPPCCPTTPSHGPGRQLTEVINSGIQPIQNLRVMQRLGREFDFEKPQQQTWSRGWIDQGFQALETLLQEHAGQYCVGDSVSFADLCLVPQIYNARRFSVDLDQFPTILGIEERLAALPAFKAAHPDQQPDAVLLRPNPCSPRP